MGEVLGSLLFMVLAALAFAVLISPLLVVYGVKRFRLRRRLRAALAPFGAVQRRGAFAIRLGEREVLLHGTHPWFFEVRGVAPELRSHVFIGPDHGPSERQALGGGALVSDVFAMFRPRVDDTLPWLAVRCFNADAARALLKHDDVTAAFEHLGGLRWASFRSGTLRLLVDGPYRVDALETELSMVFAKLSALLEALDRQKATRVHQTMRASQPSSTST